MSQPQINVLVTNAQPREAAIGELEDAATPQSVLTALVGSGIEADRVAFMQGDEGAALVQGAGNTISRLLDTYREKPVAALRAGKTLVAVFGTDGDDADAVRAALEAAGVRNRAYFGKWTVS